MCIVLEKQFIRFRISPLAAYDLSTDQTQFILYVSLLETIWGSTSTTFFWLKLTLSSTSIKKEVGPQAITDVSDGNECEDYEDESTVTLAYVSNNMGRLMIPCSDDWVDLSYVRLTNFFGHF
jgi:hypothetical protein